MSSTDNTEESKTIRVLALHGSEGNANEFPKRLKGLEEALAENANVKLEIEAVQAPFVQGNGYAWWSMPPGIRSFNAVEYKGFDTSSTKVLKAWNTLQPFDLILGHSQGAILVAALISLGKVPYHPSIGYILNGVSFPNPYTAEVESLVFQSEAPRLLFIMGVNDKITPNETGEKLRDGFQKAGLPVSTIKHPGGHGFPGYRDEKTMKDIIGWILCGHHEIDQKT